MEVKTTQAFTNEFHAHDDENDLQQHSCEKLEVDVRAKHLELFGVDGLGDGDDLKGPETKFSLTLRADCLFSDRIR